MKKTDYIAFVSFAISIGILSYALYKNFSEEYQRSRKVPTKEEFLNQKDISELLR